MRLTKPFIRLPLQFDAERLAVEIAALGESAWLPHPQGNQGNTALQFIAAHGDPANHATKGPMLPTPHLERCPYLRQLLASLETVVGRTRLMRLEPGAEAITHVDTNYYWQERVRIHVPVVTTPAVRFVCGDQSVHMGAGECWIFDTWERHNAINDRAGQRIHLVIDTVGTPEFWALVAQGERQFGATAGTAIPPRPLPFDPSANPVLVTERVNQPVVMSPWEQRWLLDQLLAEMDSARVNPQATRRELRAAVTQFQQAWRAHWALYGDTPAGWQQVERLLGQLEQALLPFDQRLRLPNGMSVTEMIRQLALRPAFNPDLAERDPAPSTAPSPAPIAPQRRRLERPVFVVSSPRSGSSLLFETLALSPDLWTIGGESHRVIEEIPGLAPADRAWSSNRLEASDADPATANRLEQAFLEALRDRDGQPPQVAHGLRMLEKTPKNALRIPFLAATFPDAYFIYLYRDPRETISSMLDAWRSGRFVTYPQLPDWTEALRWSLLLVPDWQALRGRPLAEIVARQWQATTTQLLADLSALPADRWCVASYDQLVADPQREMERLCQFIGVRWDRPLEGPLPLSRHTLTSPAPEKWRHNAAELEAVLPLVAEVAQQARELFGRPPAVRPTPTASPTQNPPAPAVLRLPQFESTARGALPELLEMAGSSLLLSSRTLGRVVLVRSRQGQVSTLFRTLPQAGAIAVGPRGVAIEGDYRLWRFQNQPAVAQKLPPEGSHDACLLPRAVHYTGNIGCRELAFAGDELWLASAHFSCLAVLDAEHSFIPRWRPRFISALAPEDRCHLNGLAVAEGRVAYVTALGQGDAPRSWQERRLDGGCLIDVASGELVASGLCLPSAPRWHEGRLWLLESGRGALGVVDLASGQVETVIQLPGFARGLSFIGPYALVGLSRLRAEAELPVAAQIEQPLCGVWVVDTRSGQRIGSVRFSGDFSEVSDIALLPGLAYPDLAEPEAGLNGSSFVLPTAALEEVDPRLRQVG